MYKFIFTLFLLMLGLHTVSLQAAEDRKICGMTTVKGTCSKFMQDDKMQPCRGVLLNTDYNDGTTGFYFVEEADDGKVLTFSGFGPNQQKLSTGAVLQPIHRVIQKDGVLGVSGQCIFENPFAGPANVECEAQAANGAWFIGYFLTDGSEPERKEFCETD